MSTRNMAITSQSGSTAPEALTATATAATPTTMPVPTTSRSIRNARIREPTLAVWNSSATASGVTIRVGKPCAIVPRSLLESAGGHRPLRRRQHAGVEPAGRADRPVPAGRRPAVRRRAGRAGPALPTGRRPPLLRANLLQRPGPRRQAVGAGRTVGGGDLRYPAAHPAGPRPLPHHHLPRRDLARPLVRARLHRALGDPRRGARHLDRQLDRRPGGGRPARGPRGVRQPRLSRLLQLRAGRPV